MADSNPAFSQPAQNCRTFNAEVAADICRVHPANFIKPRGPNKIEWRSRRPNNPPLPAVSPGYAEFLYDLVEGLDTTPDLGGNISHRTRLYRILEIEPFTVYGVWPPLCAPTVAYCVLLQ
jgi:hypothetical protein